MRNAETGARFGNKLIVEREIAGISSTKLARSVGVSLSTLSRIEAGTLSPSRELAAKVAEALRQPADDWLLAAGIVPDRVAALLADSPETLATVSELVPRAVAVRARIEGMIGRARVTLPVNAQRDVIHASRLCLVKVCTELLPSADWSFLPAQTRTSLQDMPYITPSAERTALLEGLLDDLAGLGPLYEAVVPQRKRQARGQFFTPPEIARLMAEFIPKDAKTILDPAVGAGILLAATGSRPVLFGYDVDDVAVAMAMVNLCGRGLRFSGLVGDFLAYRTTLFGEPAHGLDLYDAVICNPPYMRHHLLPKEMKLHLSSHYSQILGRAVSGLSTNYAYFFMEAMQRLSPGGSLVFITPSEFMDVGFGTAIKDMLLRSQIDELMFFERSATAFAGVMTTSCITVARKRSAPAAHKVTLSTANGGGACHRHKLVLQSRLKADDKWSHLYNGGQRKIQDLSRHRPLRLTDYVRIRRGIATGMNDYFTLSDEGAKSHSLPSRYLVPAITSAKDLPTGTLDKQAFDNLRNRGRKCWLFQCFDPADQIVDDATRAYIELGKKRGVSARYLCQTRKPWYAIERVAPPDIIVTYMTRTGPRFAANPAGCRVMSVFLNLYRIRDDVSVAELIEVLNSEETRQLLVLLGRVYSGGLGKIEPGELAKLPMPRLGGLRE